MISEKVKTIYNQYLIAHRGNKNLPFKIRKKFDETFEKSDKMASLLKLEAFFDKHPSINIKHYFDAPYKLWPDEDFDLPYYTTLKAIKAYKLYKANILDYLTHEEIKQQILDSVRFIIPYCLEHKIKSLEEYFNNHKGWGGTPIWLIHTKQGKLSLFLFCEYDLVNQVDSLSKETQEIYLDGSVLDYKNYYRKDTKLQKLVRAAIININQFLKTKLDTTKN